MLICEIDVVERCFGGDLGSPSSFSTDAYPSISPSTQSLLLPTCCTYYIGSGHLHHVPATKVIKSLFTALSSKALQVEGGIPSLETRDRNPGQTVPGSYRAIVGLSDGVIWDFQSSASDFGHRTSNSVSRDSPLFSLLAFRIRFRFGSVLSKLQVGRSHRRSPRDVCIDHLSK